MIPTIQTILTDTDGNCLAASLASIIENNINDYPQLPDDAGWYPAINQFLNSLGWNLVLIENPHAGALKGYHLIIGEAERMHCVVGLNGTVVHDPSPRRTPDSPPLKDPYYGIIYKTVY